MNRREIAHALRTMGALLEIKGEDSFKTRSYGRAADNLEERDYDLAEMARSGRLTEIPGIGKNLEPKVRELALEGRSSFLERLVEEIPAGLLDLLRVPGIGPKTARTLHFSLGVTDLDSLGKALDEHKVQGLPGMGLKREELMRRGLIEIRKYAGRLSIGTALPVLEDLVSSLLNSGIEGAIVGETGRYLETVSSLEILVKEVEGEEPVGTMERSGIFPSSGLNAGWDETNRFFSFETSFGVPLRVFFAKGKIFGTRSVSLTGPRSFLDALSARARDRGLALSVGGLVKGDLVLDTPTENDVFTALETSFLPPEVRHRDDFVRASFSGEGAEVIDRLVSTEDILGDLHVHTTWSDGVGSIEQMIAAARALGYRYIAITDHATEISMIRGLNPERLSAQLREIEDMRAKYPDIRVLSGVEVDILRSGRLYLEDDVLAGLDVVVASVHQDIGDAHGELVTRLTRAAENPHVDIIGHITGRMIGRRPGTTYGLSPIFAAAAKHMTALEVNSSPERLDIPEELASMALTEGASFAVCTDAHNPLSLPGIRLGVHSVCRRAGVTVDRVLNARDYPVRS